MTVGTKLEVVKVKFSEMERVDASLPMEVVGLSNGKNARTTVQSIVSKVTKDTVGLGKVQNLAPNELPISDAAQAALSNKLDKDGEIDMPQVNGLEDALQDLQPTVVQGSTDW